MGYLDLTSLFVYKKPLFRSQLDALAENDLWLKDNGWQDSTKAVFYQAAAPSGWTKETSQNDKFLRVVSGDGAGSGGSHAPSSTVTLNHSSHSVSSESTHTHSLEAHTHAFAESGSPAWAGVGSATIYKDSGVLREQTDTGGSDTHDQIDGNFTMDGSPTSGASGSHGHTINDSKLTNLSFAYVDIIICEKDSSSGYTDETEEFDHNEKVDADPFPILAANDNFNLERLTQVGAVSIFFNSAAPDGWTKITNQNDKALRVVSGSGGGSSSGSQGFGSTVSLAHDHAISSDGAHTHSMPTHSHTATGSPLSTYDDALGVGPGYLEKHSDDRLVSRILGGAFTVDVLEDSTETSGSGTSSDPGNHEHTVGSAPSDFVFSYCDVIQCSKDSAGHPYEFEDLSAVVSFKKLVSKQRLRKFAKNDEHIKFHTVPAASVCYFYQATAPLNWTKSTAHNDKALRIVSGTGGGSAGTQGIGSTLILAHTHSINSLGHIHTLSHSHEVATRSQGSLQSAATFYIKQPGRIQNAAIGTGLVYMLATLTTVNVSTDSAAHDHGGATGSALTNINFAYIDVIACTKDAD